MPTIVDSLAVVLQLDTSQFKKAQAEADDRMTKTKDRVAAYGRNVEKSAQGMKAGFDDVIKSALSLFAVFSGGRALGEFIHQTTDANAALGRLAANLNMAPEDLSAFQNAVFKAGGTAEGASSSLTTLFNQIVALKTEGKAAPDWFFRIGGANLDTSKGPLATYLQLAENLEKYQGNRGEKNYIAQQLGLDAGTANFTLGGIAKIKQALADARTDALTDHQAKSAAALQEAWRGLENAANSLGNEITESLDKPFVNVINHAHELVEYLKSVHEGGPKKIVQGYVKGNLGLIGDYLKLQHWLSDQVPTVHGSGGAVLEHGKEWFEGIAKEAKDWWNKPSTARPMPSGADADIPSYFATPESAHLSNSDFASITGVNGWADKIATTPQPISLGGSEVSFGNPLPVTIHQQDGGSKSFWDWLTGGSSGSGGTGGGGGGGTGGGGWGGAFNTISHALNRAAGGDAALTQSGGTTGPFANAAEYKAFARQAAIARGLNPDDIDAIFRGEGGYNPNWHGGGDEGSSFGPFQLHYGGISSRYPHSGLGDQFTKETGLSAKTNTTTRQQIEWAMNYIAMHGYGPWFVGPGLNNPHAYLNNRGAPAGAHPVAISMPTPGGLPVSGSTAASAGTANHLKTSSNSTSNQVHIGSLAVHTQATDAAGIVRDIRPTLTSDLFAARANYGLA